MAGWANGNETKRASGGSSRRRPRSVMTELDSDDVGFGKIICFITRGISSS